MDLAKKCVIVVGLGASGVAAARLCAKKGAKTIGLDAKKPQELSEQAKALSAEGVELCLGSNDAAGDLSVADLIVVSPGVPSFPELLMAEKKGVETVSEIELSYRCMKYPAPVIAIGGTNGKSTTTTLVGHILTARGMHVFVGGNLGEPFATHACERFDAVVLEVSSFQMERVQQLRPRVAALLNVTADHLDRYPTLEAYAHAKGNGFVRQGMGDVAVIPANDPLCLEQAKRGKGRIVTFGPGGTVEVKENTIVDHTTGKLFSRAEIALLGGHNAANVAAAIACVAPFDVPLEVTAAVLARFKGLDHRMTFVAEKGGVRYYDDSKGTNVGASVTAVLGVQEPKVVLIAGGREKGGSYEPLVTALREKGRAVVVLGEAADAIARAIGDALPVERASSMPHAVTLASNLALRGDAVLLSPACSSYDMFTDYKHRGNEFASAVRHLVGGT